VKSASSRSVGAVSSLTDAERGRRPVVLHLVYRFDTGGLENRIVNLINRLPATAYRHAVVALTEVAAGSENFVRGIERTLLHACRHAAIALTEVVTRIGQHLRHKDAAFNSLHEPPRNGMKLRQSMLQVCLDLIMATTLCIRAALTLPVAARRTS
jgi:hypothetical protein